MRLFKYWNYVDDDAIPKDWGKKKSKHDVWDWVLGIFAIAIFLGALWLFFVGLQSLAHV